MDDRTHRAKQQVSGSGSEINIQLHTVLIEVKRKFPKEVDYSINFNEILRYFFDNIFF
jgi:hypothetical protein